MSSCYNELTTSNLLTCINLKNRQPSRNKLQIVCAVGCRLYIQCMWPRNVTKSWRSGTRQESGYSQAGRIMGFGGDGHR